MQDAARCSTTNALNSCLTLTRAAALLLVRCRDIACLSSGISHRTGLNFLNPRSYSLHCQHTQLNPESTSAPCTRQHHVHVSSQQVWENQLGVCVVKQLHGGAVRSSPVGGRVTHGCLSAGADIIDTKHG